MKRLTPKKPWTRKTRLAASKKSLVQATISSRPKKKDQSRSRRNELIQPHQELKERLSGVVAKIITFGIKRCPTCTSIRRGSGWNLTNSHVCPRRVDATAFDIFPGGNCVAQCLNCNNNHTQRHYDRPSDRPLVLWFVKTYGQEAFDLVERRWNRAEKVDVVDLADRLELYKQILELLTAGSLRLEELIVDVESGTVTLPDHLLAA